MIERLNSLKKTVRNVKEIFSQLAQAGTVPPESWSKEDQRRLRAGQKPKGYPDHPNV